MLDILLRYVTSQFEQIPLFARHVTPKASTVINQAASSSPALLQEMSKLFDEKKLPSYCGKNSEPRL
jgi:hypothetical protein